MEKEESAAGADGVAAVGGATEEQKFFDPVTGEQISKNAWKKLQKGTVKKEKSAKPPAPPAGEGGAEKKEKKPKKEKEAEQIYEDSTPKGQMKLLEVFPPTYQPKYVEAAWQSWWEECGFYKPNVEEALAKGEADKFVMVIPPPNVTGSLHLGHALTTAVEDTLTRWHRMKGKITLWVPGTDHAGIATQSVVEKKLKKDEGLSRRDLGREAFVKRVWEWKEAYGNRITTQIRYLGASVDWSREAFTMDSNLSRAVTEAFVRFHKDGLLYRDTRLINWSCALQSAVSDIEVDHIQLEDRTFLAVPNHKLKEKYEFGVLTSFAYKVEGSDEEIVVATTRLETMLGDTAVAVHPDDERYKHLHGKFLVHPFVDRRIPIVTDDKLVDMSFGTGAVKVTPAHDPNDYECGKRKDLEFIIVLTEDGKIAANGGTFAGMMRYDARIEVEKELTTLGLFRGKAKNAMRLGICSRSGDIIEPMLTPQWYVNCTSMAQRSIDAVRSGELKILPEMHEGTWYYWLENIRDWCISRQLWWGHRIPAYFARIDGEERLDKNDIANNSRWVVARTQADALAEASAVLGVDASKIILEQDEDVLDTWFSSGLFPFSVFGWPDNTADLQAFYPTQLLETGLDILFFWVARMVMIGLHLTGKLPFTTVYLHAMVRDKHGKKMSKSLGNVIDPLEVINGCDLETLLRKIDEGNLPPKEVERSKSGQKEDFPDGIPECGADALRFGLLAYTVQGRDVNLDIKRVVGYRQFCNKLWNAVRFALTYLSDFDVTPTSIDTITRNAAVSPRDRFILSRLNTTIKECDFQLSQYGFGALTTALYSFFLYDFCDVYLELVKPVVNDTSPENSETKRCAQATLFVCLENFLRLAHPIMPFVTEELWQRLPGISNVRRAPSIMVSSYPVENPEWANPKAESDMEIVKDAIHGGRSLRSDYRIANHVKADFYFRTENTEVDAIFRSQGNDFCTLSKGSFLRFLAPGEPNPKNTCIKVISDQLSLLVDLTGLIDIDQELQRLGKEKVVIETSVMSLKNKMDAPGYDSKVPEAVRFANTEKFNGLNAELDALKSAMSAFEAMRL